jgi:hypothetical protein
VTNNRLDGNCFVRVRLSVLRIWCVWSFAAFAQQPQLVQTLEIDVTTTSTQARFSSPPAPGHLIVLTLVSHSNLDAPTFVRNGDGVVLSESAERVQIPLLQSVIRHFVVPVQGNSVQSFTVDCDSCIGHFVGAEFSGIPSPVVVESFAHQSGEAPSDDSEIQQTSGPLRTSAGALLYGGALFQRSQSGNNTLLTELSALDGDYYGWAASTRNETVEMSLALEENWFIWLMSIASKPSDPDAGGAFDAGTVIDGGGFISPDAGTAADGGDTAAPQEFRDSGTLTPMGVESPVGLLARSYTVRSGCGIAQADPIFWLLGLVATLWALRARFPFK